MQICGVVLFDSRLWHAVAPNQGDGPRIVVPVRYAPWWLNLDILMLGSQERARMIEGLGLRENEVAPIPRDIFAALPEKAKPLFRHWAR